LYVGEIRDVFEALYFDMILARLEIHDRVVTYRGRRLVYQGQRKDEPISPGLSRRRDDRRIAPHLIVSWSADQRVVPAFCMVQKLGAVAVHLRCRIKWRVIRR